MEIECIEQAGLVICDLWIDMAERALASTKNGTSSASSYAQNRTQRIRAS
jgi:hypothetical protein